MNLYRCEAYIETMGGHMSGVQVHCSGGFECFCVSTHLCSRIADLDIEVSASGFTKDMQLSLEEVVGLCCCLVCVFIVCMFVYVCLCVYCMYVCVFVCCDCCRACVVRWSVEALVMVKMMMDQAPRTMETSTHAVSPTNPSSRPFRGSRSWQRGLCSNAVPVGADQLEGAGGSFSLQSTGEDSSEAIADCREPVTCSACGEDTMAGLVEITTSILRIGSSEEDREELTSSLPAERDSISSSRTAGVIKEDDIDERSLTPAFSPLPRVDGRDSGSESVDNEEVDRDRSGGPHLPVDTMSVASGASIASSYLHGEEGPAQVRHLVHCNLLKKQKEQRRLTRPKESKRVAAGSQRREKRAHKIKIKESLEVDFF